MPEVRNILYIVATGFALLVHTGISAANQQDRLRAGSSEHSVFKSVWTAILEETGLEVGITPARARVRRFWFVDDQIQLDCCSIPAWRGRPAELEMQLYTDVLFDSVQFLIHHEDMKIQYNGPDDLSRYRVGVIVGHSHIHEEKFGSKVVVNSYSELFKLIAEGGADIASANEQEFRFQMGRADWPIVRGPIFHRLSLRARVRKEHAELVPKLNQAIEKLRKNGKIDMLIGTAIRDEVY